MVSDIVPLKFGKIESVIMFFSLNCLKNTPLNKIKNNDTGKN